MKLKDLIPDMSTFMRYAPGVDTSNHIDDLEPSSLVAFKSVTSLVGDRTLRAIIQQQEGELMEALRRAVANRTMASHVSFDSINQRKSGTDVYKYEVEKMVRGYLDNYYSAVDTLLQLLMTGREESGGDSPQNIFYLSRMGMMVEECRIRSCEEFDRIFPIDMSYLFFFRTIPLQIEVLRGRMGAYFAKAEEGTSVYRQLLLALAKLTVATALSRFDITEFPSTIRNLFDDSKASRNGRDEYERQRRMELQLYNEAQELMDAADLVMSEHNGNNYCSNSSYNDPSDTIIMMP